MYGFINQQKAIAEIVKRVDELIKENEMLKLRAKAAEDVAVNLESEWRRREEWIGEKRPEQIKLWVVKEIEKRVSELM